MKNTAATSAPRLTLKKERIVCLNTTTLATNVGKSYGICELLTVTQR